MSTSGPEPSASLKGKRKKKLPTNPNPLFTQWLQEWKDEANEKGWKSAHTYGMALKTLKLFPLTLESGKDCKLLRNFGDKICKMLDEKLAQYKLNGGVLPVAKEPQSESAPSTSAGIGMVQTNASSNGLPKTRQPSATNVASQFASSPTKRKGPMSVSSAGLSSSRTGAHTVSDDSGSDTEGRPPPQKKRASSDNSREYVPAYRSGPYALILSLYRIMQAPGYRGFVLKAELIETAQPLADKSFTIVSA
ncbi:crossover junction endonuclease MUS81-like [Elysia marginata]|uniref:Crossover junction endonuclease MUS81 n=1 Tax=Elysia marginata TaxID=1093978 RepID=A0AAV4I574_9GAST|nr:crossover junction endonuclease MUS81-like [Elysia marginata]